MAATDEARGLGSAMVDTVPSIALLHRQWVETGPRGTKVPTMAARGAWARTEVALEGVAGDRVLTLWLSD